MSYMHELRKQVGSAPLIMVGAAVLIVNHQNELLMLLRTDNGCWGIPGGAMEPGESLEETARRETFEETGLTYSGPLFTGCFFRSRVVLPLPGWQPGIQCDCCISCAGCKRRNPGGEGRTQPLGIFSVRRSAWKCQSADQAGSGETGEKARHQQQKNKIKQGA